MIPSQTLQNILPGFGSQYTGIAVFRVGNCWEALIDVTIGACPHCRSTESLCALEVERHGYPPETWPIAVHCGTCGARGSWGKDEEAAMYAWNQVTGVNTVVLRHGHAMQFPLEPIPDDDDYPF